MDHQKKFKSLQDLSEISDHKTVGNPHVPRQHDGREKKVQVILDTHGRKGKSVTVVIGLQHNPATMAEIARILKQYCGAGGTVKEGKIEIQGDQRGRVTEKLKALNYLVQ